MIIKLGTHSPLRMPRLADCNRPTQYSITFTPSCKYEIGSDQSDVNKLFGIGYLPHHHSNSVRFGWRYMKDDCINVLAYWYRGGKREFLSIADVPIGKEYVYVLTPSSSCHTLEIVGLTEKVSVPVPKGRFGYLLLPYFGGNKTAPHDIEIFINK